MEPMFPQILHDFVDVFTGQFALWRKLQFNDKFRLAKSTPERLRQIIKDRAGEQIQVGVIFSIRAKYRAIHVQRPVRAGRYNYAPYVVQR